MVRTLLVWFVLFAVCLSAEEASAGLAELYADRFENEGDRVTATGHVVLSYGDTLFLGDRARYDRRTETIILEGHVEILSDRGRGSKILADRVVFDVADNRVQFSDFYRSGRDDIWIYAEEARSHDGNYTLRNSMLSSCSVKDPDWSVRFKEARYDARTKYIRLKGVKVYAGEFPLLYTPYLGFSLERERHSGFLMPHLGISGEEGFYYEQPYFWAISPSMDLEINPVLRTGRGYGIYGTYRFVDGPRSGGEIRGGYFRDYDSFVRDHALAHREHYGLEMYYESADLLGALRPAGYRDGFYLNLNLFNDIDYLNLQNSNLEHLDESRRYKESRLNSFLYNDERYVGLGARYFIDTAERENNETIQMLPMLRYHSYAAPLPGGWIDYSVDARFANLWREDGSRAAKATVSLPLEFRAAVWEDYLTLTVREEFAASDTKFYGGALHLARDHYASAVVHHNVELASDLIRAYDSGIHTLQLSALFTKTTLLAEGDLRYESIDQSLVDDFDLEMVYDSRLAFAMHHFWESADQRLKMDYLMVADYYPDNDSRWNMLRQELHLNYGRFAFTSRIDYSIHHRTFAQLSNALSYSDDAFGFKVEHTRLDNDLYEYPDQDEIGTLDQNELSFAARYRLNDMLTWYGEYTYDFKENESKDWQAGVLLDRKCWNAKMVFVQTITPVLKDEGRGSIRENKIYFQFNLVPFGGAGSGKEAPI